MTLQTVLDDAKAVTTTLQEELAAAQLKVASAQAAIDAALPHIALLAKIEIEVGNMEAGVGSRVTQAITEIKNLFNL